MTNIVDPDQIAPTEAVLSGSNPKLVSNVWQLFAADDFSRRHFSDAFFLGALKVNRKMHETSVLTWGFFHITC